MCSFSVGKDVANRGNSENTCALQADEAEYGTCMRLILGIRKELTLKVKQAEGKTIVT